MFYENIIFRMEKLLCTGYGRSTIRGRTQYHPQNLSGNDQPRQRSVCRNATS